MVDAGAGLDSFMGAPQGAEQTKESQDKFQERYTQNQAAIKQIQKDEAKAKKNDDQLAGLIAQFLAQGDRGAHFLLIARLLAANIPSDIILAMIALVEPSANLVLQEKLQNLPKPSENPDKGSRKSIFPEKVKTDIDTWTNSLNIIAVSEARRLVKTAVEPDGKHNSGLTQLFALVLREFLESHQVTSVPMNKIQAFGGLVLGAIFGTLKKMVGDEHQLKATN